MNATNSPSDSQPAAQPPKKKRRVLRWVLTLIAVLLLFMLVVAYALPGILSGGWGKRRVLSAVNGSIPGTVSIDRMSLSWFGQQTIDGIALVDPDGSQVATVKHVAVPVGLWSLLWGGRDLGTIEVERPVLTVVAKDDSTNLMQAVQPSAPGSSGETEKQTKDNESFELPVKFKLKLTDGKITATPPQGADVVFDNVNVTIDAEQLNQPLAFDLNTLTRQGDLSGKVKATGSINLATGQVNANADVNDLPVAGLDTLANQNGLLIAAVGPTLNAHAEIIDEAGNRELQVTANAANLSVTFNGDTTRDLLSGSGEIKLTATPALAQKLAARGGGDSSGTLAADVPVTVTINTLTLPISGFDPSKVAMNVSIAIGAGRFTGLPQTGDVSWSDFAALIKSENLAEKLQAAANGKFTADGKAGSLVASADVLKLFDENGKPAIEQATVDADATLKDLPVALIDRLAGQNGQLVDALGDRLTATAIAHNDGQGHINATINAESPTLRSAVLPITIGKRITLSQPGSVVYAVPQVLLNKYVTDASGYRVAVGQPITLAIDTLDMPTPGGDVKLTPGDITLSATLTVKDVTVNDPAGVEQTAAIGLLTIPQVVVKLDGRQMDKPHVTATANWSADQGMVAQYAAKRYAVTIDAATTLDPQFQPGPVTLAVNGKPLASESQPLDVIALTGEISKGFTQFKLTDPAAVTYHVTSAVAPAEGTVKATITQLQAPVKGFTLAGVTAKANVNVPQMTLSGDEHIAGTKLTGGQADVTFDGPANTLKLTADAKTQLPHQSSAGAITVDANLKNVLSPASGKPDIMNAVGTAKVNVTDLPTAFVDAVAGQNGLVAAALGDKVNVNATVNAPASGGGMRTADVTMHSPLLDASGSVAMAEGKPIEVTKPVLVTWTLQPAAYAKLAGDEVALTDPVKVAGTIRQLSWPTSSESKNALAGAKIDATFNAGKLALQPKGGQAVASVSDLQLSLASADLSQAVTAKLGGKVGYVQQGAAPVTGNLDANATLSNLFDASGKLDFKSINAKVDAKLADVPTASLDTLAKQDGLIAAALGGKVTIDANADLAGGKGPITLTVDAANANAKIPAELNAGVVTLTDNMTASFMITEQLSKKLIDHPLLKQAVRSEKPVTLVVQKDGFKLPLMMLISGDEVTKHLGLSQIAIGKATLDPGKVVVNNAGLINTLVTLPENVGKLAQLKIGDVMSGLRKDELIAWFTPMDVTMHDGVVTMSRMDMLIGDNYQVATWGSINLGYSPATVAGRQIPARYGDMVLGITERALRRIYGVTAFKDDPNYVDQFVMKGPLDSLSPDTKELTARLLFLTAGGTAAKIGGSKVGDIIGDIMKGATQVKNALDKTNKDQPPTPAPYQPYPWPAEDKSTNPTASQQADQQNQQNTTTNENQQQMKEKPEEKIIKDVLKDIFGKKKK